MEASSWEAYVLVHVNVSAARASNTDANVVFSEELACQLTASLVEGCREHHVTMVRILVGVCLGQPLGPFESLAQFLPPPDMIRLKSSFQSD